VVRLIGLVPGPVTEYDQLLIVSVHLHLLKQPVVKLSQPNEVLILCLVKIALRSGNQHGQKHRSFLSYRHDPNGSN
jgi:hypothetical protein